MEEKLRLFERPGEENTDEALKIALMALNRFSAKKVIVASTTGKTGLKALKIIPAKDLIVVSHTYGLYEPNVDEMDKEARNALLKEGVPVLTTTHTFAGFARSVRSKFSTHLTEDIVANVLRTVCEGFKVSYELSCMCADAGLIDSGDRVICVAGTAEGADTVVMLQAANSHRFFEIKVEAVFAMPINK